MITTKLYLDCRTQSSTGECPLKITLTKRGKSAHFPLGVKLMPNQWDATRLIVTNHPNKKLLNNHISKLKIEVDDTIMSLREKGELDRLSISEIKNLVYETIHPSEDNRASFYDYFVKFGKAHRASRTRELYAETANFLKKYKKTINRLSFEDITLSWLYGFEEHLKKREPSANSRNIHLRNIRAAFNGAIDDGLTTFYPFRKFKIRPVATKKRSLLKNQIRTIFDLKPETEAQEWAIDFMKLSFLLIGINTIDLCNLKEIDDGRIYYTRSKTHRDYSVLVPKEAMVLINKHKGNGYLIDALNRYKSVKTLSSTIDRHIKAATKDILGLPKISMYWMRHSWATIAAELDIPKETIAAGLGHGGNTVTDIYIDFDIRKVDQANRIVIDYILS